MNRELRMIKTPKFMVVLVTALFLIGLPAQQALAAAGDPSRDPTAAQYNDPGSTVNENDGSDEVGLVVNTPSSGDPAGTAGSTAGTSSGASLPFTGFDVGVLAIVAVLLGATGLALRRLSAAK